MTLKNFQVERYHQAEARLSLYD